MTDCHVTSTALLRNSELKFAINLFLLPINSAKLMHKGTLLVSADGNKVAKYSNIAINLPVK